jgi:hypothetical protein
LHWGKCPNPKEGEPTLGSSMKLRTEQSSSSSHQKGSNLHHLDQPPSTFIGSSIHDVHRGSPTGCISRSVSLDAPGDTKNSTYNDRVLEQHSSNPRKSGIHGNEAVMQQRPAKKARLLKALSSRSFVCVGKCPNTWTIDSYCESCHG